MFFYLVVPYKELCNLVARVDMQEFLRIPCSFSIFHSFSN